MPKTSPILVIINPNLLTQKSLINFLKDLLKQIAVFQPVLQFSGKLMNLVQKLFNFPSGKKTEDMKQL